MADPRVISLDIETYGACEKDALGKPLAPQTTMHPARSGPVDSVHPPHQILTVAITLPTADPRPSPGTPWTTSLLARLRPAHTLTFQMSSQRDRTHLRRWLSHADTILGWNLPYDITYLRADTQFSGVLNDQKHFLIDGTVMANLHNSERPEKSLKDISRLLAIHVYEETLKDGKRFPHPTHPKHLQYNALDSHNTILDIAQISLLIESQFAGTPKTEPFVLQHYSDLLWLCTHLSTHGIEINKARTLRRRSRLLTLAALCSLEAAKGVVGFERGLVLETHKPVEDREAGGNKAKDALIDRILSLVPEAASHPLLRRTKVQRKVQWSPGNRAIFRLHLPADDPLQRLLDLGETHAKACKLVSSYLDPLLEPSTHPKSCGVPSPLQPLSNLRLHPAWFATASAEKDDQGDTGGQVQGRISAKNPACQTWPKSVKWLMTSRWGPKGRIWSVDLSQAELRFAGLLSGDEAILTAYRENRDLHTERAIQIYGEDRLCSLYGTAFRKHDRFKEVERQVGKTMNFADLFLAAPPTMQLTVFRKLGFYMQKAIFEQIVRDRPFVRPGLWAWQQSLIEQARATGRIVLDIVGISRYFPGDPEGDHLNEIVNFPVQSHSAVAFHRICHRMVRLIGYIHLPRVRIRPIMQVHDAMYLDVHNDDSKHLPEMMAEATDWVCTQDYVARLSEKVGRTVPIKYDLH